MHHYSNAVIDFWVAFRGGGTRKKGETIVFPKILNSLKKFPRLIFSKNLYSV